MSSITILTRVYNCGGWLDRCLSSVDWADRIFCVVDPETNDDSADVARRYTDEVVFHEHKNAAAQWNWALPQIETEWTLVLDADEWVSPGLKKRIETIIRDETSLDGYLVKRQTYFLGRLIKHCGWQSDYNLRLFRTGKGRYTPRRVHPYVEIQGSTGRIDEVMFHEPYRSFSAYLKTLDRFSTWAALDRFESGVRAGFFHLAVKPAARFVRMFVLQSGFLDGVHGFVVCALGAFSVFVKYAKVWRLAIDKRINEHNELDNI